jgi:hypothetical protein
MKNTTARANHRSGLYVNVGSNLSAIPDPHIGPNTGEGADSNITSQFRAGVDFCILVYGHFNWSMTGKYSLVKRDVPENIGGEQRSIYSAIF